MKEKKRFENKKLNKEDYKGMEQGAKAVKKGIGFGGMLLTAGIVIKKAGIKTVKDLPKLATMLIKR